MRVITLVGSQAGQVIDLPPRSARAMLADGRATLPTEDAGPAPTPVGVVESRDPIVQAAPMPRRRRR